MTARRGLSRLKDTRISGIHPIITSVASETIVAPWRLACPAKCRRAGCGVSVSVASKLLLGHGKRCSDHLVHVEVLVLGEASSEHGVRLLLLQQGVFRVHLAVGHEVHRIVG